MSLLVVPHFGMLGISTRPLGEGGSAPEIEIEMSSGGALPSYKMKSGKCLRNTNPRHQMNWKRHLLRSCINRTSGSFCCMQNYNRAPKSTEHNSIRAAEMFSLRF